MEATEFINEYKKIIVNGGIIILSIIIAINIYNKQVKNIESLEKRKDEESRRAKVLENISSLEKKASNYKRLLSKRDASEVINTITELSRATDINIISIRPLQPQSFTEYEKLPFELIILVPNYHALGKFVNEIENLNDVYLVEAISFDSKPKSKDKNLTVNLQIASISLKD